MIVKLNLFLILYFYLAGSILGGIMRGEHVDDTIREYEKKDELAEHTMQTAHEPS